MTPPTTYNKLITKILTISISRAPIKIGIILSYQIYSEGGGGFKIRPPMENTIPSHGFLYIVTNSTQIKPITHKTTNIEITVPSRGPKKL